MNHPPNTVASAPVPPRRRRVWPWIAGLTLAPFVLLAAVGLSYVTLDRDAAALRGQVMRASGARWHTKVQLSVGSLTLGAVRTLLYFIHENGVAEARAALSAVRGTSVGVYELPAGAPRPDVARAELFAQADRTMQRRGWTRLVGVTDQTDTVLIYVPTVFTESEEMEICLAVLSGRELVVNTTRLVPAELLKFVERRGADGLKERLHVAGW